MENVSTERRQTRSSKKVKRIRSQRTSVQIDVDVDEREKVEIVREILKPTQLHDEDDDVGEGELYRSSAVKKGAMLAKARASRYDSLKQLKQHSSSKISQKKESDHGHFIKGLTTSEEESVSEDSEYLPENSDETENENEIETDEIEEENIEDISDRENKVEDREVVRKSKLILNKAATSSSQTPKKVSQDEAKYEELNLDTEEYFSRQSERVQTSNRTLGRLKGEKLDKEKIDKLLESQLHISPAHVQGICQLEEKNKANFPFWHFLLEQGFSILLYGLGSKRKLINDFHEEIIGDFPTLIVNGFFPSLTLKEILSGIIKDLMDLEVPTNVDECMDLIEQKLRKHPKGRIYLLIHNIDGAMLRSSKIQNYLSYLASFPNLHLVASVDHINASLLWDNAKRSRFNFYWSDTTTFLPYKDETLYENSLMVRQSGVLALSSLNSVFMSLPGKSRSVYMILVQYQIENDSTSYQGMSFKDLLQKARQKFLVTNDVTLRAQLTEFRDHKLIKEKRAIDGIEYLSIPLDTALLKQFLEQQEESLT